MVLAHRRPRFLVLEPRTLALKTHFQEFLADTRSWCFALGRLRAKLARRLEFAGSDTPLLYHHRC